MNETEWLAAIDPGRMIWYSQSRFPERKRQLFAAACLRRIWEHLPGSRSKNVIDLLERFADGDVTSDELAIAREAARDEAYEVDHGGNRHPSQDAAMAASFDDTEQLAYFAVESTVTSVVGSAPEEHAQAVLVREIFGNPFRPITIDPEWLTSTVVSLAKSIYDERAFSILPILADALQDAGCEQADILDHCRDPHLTHVRGCWVVDLLLGKS